MLVAHALWSPGRGPLIWGVDSELPVKSPSQAVRSTRAHPFAADASVLAEVHAGKPVTAVVLLPSLRLAPLHPPELVRAAPRPAPRQPPALLPWAVPALLVDPAELAEERPQLRYGSSAAYLRALATFADDLAARGRVLPSLRFETGEPVARWRPVVSGPDAVRMHGFVAAMPPVVRAEQDGPGDTSGQDPAVLVADALDVLVDRAVRARLGRSAAPLDLVPPRRGRRPDRAPAVEGWLAALTAGDGRLPADQAVDEAGVADLAKALSGWDAVGAEPTGPARALFRLTEPPPDVHSAPGDALWRLEFLLQSSADPSLQVHAEQVWSAPAGLQRWIDRPQELLLRELGRATTVYPDLGPALRAPEPAGWGLDVDAAHRFLTTGAALLDAAGFGVQLPAWWDRKHRLRLVVSGRGTPADSAVVSGGMHKEALADFRWSLAVGENVLDEEEIAELVAAKAPLVRLRGHWIAVDPDRLRRGLEFLHRPRATVTAADVLALAAAPAGGRGPPAPAAASRAPAAPHAEELDLPGPLVDVQVTGWVGDVLAGTADRTLRPVEPPATFTARLRPYQSRGLSWLAFLSGLGLGACLADDMGLGKTIQLLALEAAARAALGTAGPTLLLCPMSLVGNWQREASRFAPGLRVYAHHGSGRLHGEELTAQLAEADLVVTTYGTAVRDVEELAAHEWHRLALAEAQAIKNSQATASRTVRRLTARHRIALTGTPLENRLSELWSIMDVLNPGLLGSAEKFRSRFAIPVERHGNDEAAQLLRRITRPYLLRRAKTDPAIIDDLPDKIEIVQDYRLTPEQASLYQTVVDDMMEKIEGSDGIERRGRVLAAMAKLKQVCNHPAQLLHDGSPVGNRSGKVTRLEEILTEILAEGDKVLCFTQFTEFGDMLVPHLSARFGQ